MSDSDNTQHHPLDGALRFVAYVPFLASGAAGLIYEIVWTRKLIYVFGSGLYAVTAVLSAFMAGLALGSWLLGMRADRLRHPLRFYAMIETALACVGLMMPLALDQLDAVDHWAYRSFGQDFAFLTFCRFAVSFAMLLIPTTLMGATLPVLSKALVRHEGHLGLRIGELYAVNTFGAVAGAFFAGFHLIGAYGVFSTNVTAAALNTFAAIGTYLISGRTEKFAAAIYDPEFPPKKEELSIPFDQQITEPIEPRRVAVAEAELEPKDAIPVGIVLFSAFASGLIAMGAQVIWSRGLVFNFEYLKNTTYAFSAMLTVFLAGIALGSIFAGMIADRAEKPLRLYGVILALIGITMAWSVQTLHAGAGIYLLGRPFTETGDGTQVFRWGQAVFNILAQSAFVLGVPTFLMGMAFPVAARAIARARVGRDVGRLYAVNTFGSILGPLVASFIVIPLMGLTAALLAFAAAECCLGLIVIACAPNSKKTLAGVTTMVAAVLIAVIMMVPRGEGMQQLNPGEKVLYYEEGPMATVSVIENNFGYNTINIDGVGVAGTDPMLQTDQKSLAHLPMLLVENPKSALTVGFGSGGASYSYLLHDRLEHMHCAEICKEVPRAAPYLKDANHGFLERNDPRYKIVFDDVRSYLRHTETMYDTIATDCTDLRYKSNASLYDLEYFQFCRSRLNPGGIVVVWMPLAGLENGIFRVALRTFHKVFPEMAVFFMTNEPTHYILLVGWRDKMEIDFARMRDRLAEADVKADLGELYLDDPVKLLSTWIIGGPAVDEYLKGDKINTEDKPHIEFESPKYGYNDRPILDNLDSMMTLQNSSRDYITSGTATTEELAKLERFERALPEIVKGHAYYRILDIEHAAEEYLKAQALTPDDASLENVLEFRELQIAARELDSPWHWMMYGRVLQMRGRPNEAADCYLRAQRIYASLNAPPNSLEAAMFGKATRWIEEIKNAAKK